uniref:Uncharacterized protein n=1 Tax=Mycena chlorophos TaxID=658473 RepID=A0ABQ0MDG1_MYCCL|nr:predicted protein [Mycena chlorophos]
MADNDKLLNAVSNYETLANGQDIHKRCRHMNRVHLVHLLASVAQQAQILHNVSCKTSLHHLTLQIIESMAAINFIYSWDDIDSKGNNNAKSLVYGALFQSENKNLNIQGFKGQVKNHAREFDKLKRDLRKSKTTPI